MLLLLHGDNTVLSRSELNRALDAAKAQGIRDVVRFDGKKLTLNALTEACEAGSLFGTNRLVIIENLFANLSKDKLKKIVEYLRLIPHSLFVILWSAKTLTPGQLKALQNFTPKLFKTSPAVFKVCDSLGISPTPVVIDLLHQAIAADTAEFVFFMMTRHLRLLLQTTDPGFKLAPWQMGKLKQQFQRLGESRIVKMHHDMATIDWRIKSGQSAHGLTGELELLLTAE